MGSTGRLLQLVAVVAVASRAHGEGPQGKELRRGLIATYKGSDVEIVRLEPTVALALKEREAPHPRLPSESLKVTWKGSINIVRAGGHRFDVRLRGDFRLSIAGKEVLKANSAKMDPVLIEGAEVQLEAGVQTLVAEFSKRPGGGARVELLWHGPGFRREPLPDRFVGHIPEQESPALAAESRVEHGRFLFEEASCVRCHRPDEKDRVAAGLHWRAGPDLSKVGARAYRGWIERWLESPRKMRPSAAMPELFGHDEIARAERYAVASYLATLGGPVKPSANQEDPARKQRGKTLFNTVGCAACHGKIPLRGLGSKTTPELLAEYLKNPLAIDPSGRMPSMLLNEREALDLARFLCADEDRDVTRELGTAPARDQVLAAFKRVEPRADEWPTFEKLTPAAAWIDLGKRLVIARGCNNCHTIEPDGKPFAEVQANADLDDLKKMDNPKTGCLAEKREARSAAPHYGFNDGDRAALRAFLRTGLNGAGSPAPAHAAHADLRRFNCLACHSRAGEGGLAPDTIDLLKKHEMADNVEAVTPPPLTSVAYKLRTSWLRQVLTSSGRARPWMALRMPQFGENQVGHLPEALAALDGTEADAPIHKVAMDAKTIEAGRLLVGKTALGCVSCHDIAGKVSGGTRGPDLALMTQRVRHEWYERWLEQAQRMQPGTKMPEVFIKGKSLFDKLYDGDAGLQAEAIWAYLSLGPKLPLPRP